MSHPLQQFVINPIVPVEIGGVDVSFTQSSLWMALAVIASTLLLIVAMRPKALVPGRFQNVAEILYDLVNGLLTDAMGKSEARKFFPFVFSVFMIVLMGNMLGMIPYSFTYTSHIIVTASLAIMVFLVSVIVGLCRHGLHWFSLFLPKGLPFFMAPLVIIIELVSFMSRPISLSVRLFANMLAGHTMMKVFAGFCVSLVAAGTVGAMAGILPLLFNSALIGLELMIAFIQAFVFTTLTCLYLKEAVELH